MSCFEAASTVNSKKMMGKLHREREREREREQVGKKGEKIQMRKMSKKLGK
jgi:hypothetical protein